MSGYAESMACLHMSSEVGPQSEASYACAAMKGLCMRLEVLASVMSAETRRASTRNPTCSDLRQRNVSSIDCNSVAPSSPWFWR